MTTVNIGATMVSKIGHSTLGAVNTLIDHAPARVADTGNQISGGGPGNDYSLYSYDPNTGSASQLVLTQAISYYDLSSIPTDAVITAATLDIVIGAGAKLNWGFESTEFAMLGGDEAIASAASSQYKPMNVGGALFDNFDMTDTTPQLVATAAGRDVIKSWLVSNQAMQLAMVPQAMLDNYDASTTLTHRYVSTGVITSQTLNITYEFQAGMLGFNF